jgi:hypothetical protein
MVEANRERRAEITIRLSEFEMPPMQDVLIVGRSAPIGPEAARRMVDALSPEQYEIIPVQHAAVEAVVVRKRLLSILPQERLIPLVLEECSATMMETSVIKAHINIDIVVTRRVDL